MATKRYTPTLNIIVEENSSMNSGNPKIKRTNSQVSGTESSSCKHCSPNQLNGPIENGTKNCDNCGDKRKGIEKWLESVPMHGQEKSNVVSQDTKIPQKSQSPHPKQQQPRKKSISPPKTKPPPPPVGLYPKVVSHSLKPSTTQVEIKQNQQAPPHSPHLQDTKSSKASSPSPSQSNKTANQKNNYYSFASFGSDIYNNPKFSLTDSPANTQKSKNSNQSSKNKNKIEVYDQYSNHFFDKNDQTRYEDILRNIKQMPDMVYEALTRDYSLRKYSKSNVNSYNIPTPDYDSTMEKNNKEIYNSGTQSSAPSVPTPDYSTLSLGRKYQQPDSPIYRRKSPQYLIVDYETDSLERSTTNRKCSTSSSNSPSSNNSSEVSSQPSPSLSTALPLEEEVEVHHTIYDKVDGFRKDGDCSSRKTNRPEDKKSKEMEARIKYDTPYMGSMTIEVEHEPQSDFEISTDSDQYEPDTLDRKPKKHSFCDVENLNAAWTDHLTKAQKFVNCQDDRVSYSSLENMNSLPDFTTLEKEKDCPKGNQLTLRSANSFRSAISPNLQTVEKQATLEMKPIFGSLREIYQSKVMNNGHQRPKLSSVDFSSTILKEGIENSLENGKILTLEAKHSRRQRSFIKEQQKCLPPDVIPPEKLNMETKKNSKNLNGWSTEDTIGETTSNHSESTEFTGVSDNHEQNSDIEEIKLRNNTKILEESSAIVSSPISTVDSEINKKLSSLRNDYSFNKYLSRKKSLESKSEIEDSQTPPLSQRNGMGMQIAMGIRDRHKKNKDIDIRQAWKKIVSIATSKFSPNSSPNITPNHTLNTNMPYDESSLPSLIDDKYFTCLEIPSKPIKINEFDSGYLSTEDNIDIYNRRLYNRLNYCTELGIKTCITEEDNINLSPSCNGGSETEEDEDNDGTIAEDMCESGAESIETHSVLYKHTRS